MCLSWYLGLSYRDRKLAHKLTSTRVYEQRRETKACRQGESKQSHKPPEPRSHKAAETRRTSPPEPEGRRRAARTRLATGIADWTPAANSWKPSAKEGGEADGAGFEDNITGPDLCQPSRNPDHKGNVTQMGTAQRQTKTEEGATKKSSKTAPKAAQGRSLQRKRETKKQEDKATNKGKHPKHKRRPQSRNQPKQTRAAIPSARGPKHHPKPVPCAIT